MLSKFLKMTAIASTSVITLMSAVPAQDLTRLTVALPVNLCLANWPFYVAAAEGYFDEEGLEVAMVGLDGSSTAIQATLAGQSQIAVSAPADILAASGQGADLVGFYSFYQYLPFSVIAPADSDIASLADLEGKTIGITSPGGGEAIYMRSLLTHAGIETGSYEELPVGEGNAAASAITGGVVDAFSASFVDEIIFKGMGLSYKALESEGYPATAGLLLTTLNDYFEANPQVIEGIGRGLARATEAGLADRDIVIAACTAAAPQETEDMGFTTAVLDGVDALFKLTDAADGRYGYVDQDIWADYRELMISIGAAEVPAADTVVVNDYVAAWNQ